ncbi:RNA methyltransferase [Gleimia sp. 6138-11-ORH1]|uniref:TrmH family RNA methyltransferase n=1 Tax=Gleimia sp. 6138-11-ORH1 TaxID=2973937 RepID=UPI0021677A7C|nr:RNA methyltransferase [Gleimia sp. 6138-11-ORH1]MCS4484460.1 RNA methyltransferase [Gleimia sp. 6138-11-ORH1]
MLIHLTDLNDERLNDYLHMTDVALRSKSEPAQGLFMAESKNVISRAINAGYRPRSFLMAPRWLDSMAEILEQFGPEGGEIPVFVAPEEFLEKLTGFHLHRGALAAMHRNPLPAAATLLASARRIAILEDIVDHTNVGAIFRSAAAIGVDAILVTPSCADPLFRRSVRVSMGTVFQVPWTRLDTWPDRQLLKDFDFEIAALALGENTLTLDQYAAELALDSTRKVAWILGSEGYGLKPRTLASVDKTVMIPMKHGVDSLNVAAAAAVTFWATK